MDRAWLPHRTQQKALESSGWFGKVLERSRKFWKADRPIWCMRWLLSSSVRRHSVAVSECRSVCERVRSEMDMGPFFVHATQPNPTHGWTQPTSISESDRIRKKEKEQWNVVLTLPYTVSWCVTIKWEESQASVSVELIPRTVYRGSPEGASFRCNSNCCVQSVMGLYMADVNIFY